MALKKNGRVEACIKGDDGAGSTVEPPHLLILMPIQNPVLSLLNYLIAFAFGFFFFLLIRFLGIFFHVTHTSIKSA